MSEDPRDERLDRVLDDALGRMAGGDGPADMRRRVLARLAEPPRRVGRRGLVLAAGAAIALAAGTALLLRGPEVPAPEAPVARREVPPATPPTLPSPAAHQRKPVHSAARAVGPPARWVAPRPSPLTRIADQAGADDAPMAPVEPIEPASLVVAPMRTETLTIAPLQMDPMEIVPLAEPRSE